MQRYVLVVASVLFLLISCATTETQPVSSPLDLTRNLSSSEGRPMFLGIAARQRDRSLEEEVAVRHVAEQASRYRRLGARYTILIRRTGATAGTLDNVITQWDEAGVDDVMNDVEVVETYVDQDGTYVIATVTGLPRTPVEVEAWPGLGDGEPAWVSRPPTLSGYLAGVGVAQRRRRLRDSVDFADQAALTELLLQSGASIRMSSESQTVENVGTRERVTASQEASTVLRGFYVVARYISMDGRTVYSLAVAREE
jgi:hypothetical protein